MEKIKDILQNLKHGVPQALARFNDGEMKAIMGTKKVIARGDQQVTTSLRVKLLDAILHRQENYWVGIPCRVCFKRQHLKAKELVGNYEYLTSAVVTANRNWKHFTSTFPRFVKKVEYVGGEDHDTRNLEKVLGIRVCHSIKTPMKNAWAGFEKHPEFANLCNHLRGEEVVILSCGPLSRVLACEWFKRRPDCTFLDVGSCFDPWTRNVWHACHKGKLKPCKGCN